MVSSNTLQVFAVSHQIWIVGVTQELEHPGSGLAVRRGVGEHPLAVVEGVLLGRIVEPGRLELVELVADQLHLAGAGPFVATEAVELALEIGHGGGGSPERAELDAGEAVERGALLSGRQQRLKGVLDVPATGWTSASLALETALESPERRGSCVLKKPWSDRVIAPASLLCSTLSGTCSTGSCS